MKRTFLVTFLCLLLIGCSKENKSFSVSNIPANGLLLSTTTEGFQIDYTGTADWASADTSIVNVSPNGYITVSSYGSTNIIARENDNTEHVYRVVVTSACQITSYSVDSPIEIAQGHSRDIMLKDIVPAEANYREFKFSVTPDDGGITVKRLPDAPGKFRIIMGSSVPDNTTYDINFTTSTAVNRTCKATAIFRPVTSFTFNNLSYSLNLREDCKKATLTWTIKPDNATVRDVSFQVVQYPDASGPVISFNENTGEIVALNYGTANIMGTCGDFTSICSVFVTEPKLTELTLKNYLYYKYYRPGSTAWLFANQTPAGLFPFTWSCSPSDAVKMRPTTEEEPAWYPPAEGESIYRVDFQNYASGWVTFTVKSGNLSANTDLYLANPDSNMDIYACIQTGTREDPNTYYPSSQDIDNTTSTVFPGEEFEFKFGINADKWDRTTAPYDITYDAFDYTRYGYSTFPFTSYTSVSKYDGKETNNNMELITVTGKESWYLRVTKPTPQATFSYSSKSKKVSHQFSLKAEIGSISLGMRTSDANTYDIIQTKPYDANGVYFTTNKRSYYTHWTIFLNRGSSYDSKTSQKANFFSGTGGGISSASCGQFSVRENGTLSNQRIGLDYKYRYDTNYTGYMNVYLTIQ